MDNTDMGGIAEATTTILASAREARQNGQVTDADAEQHAALTRQAIGLPDEFQEAVEEYLTPPE